MPRSFKVSLNDTASKDLKKVAEELGISESEVLRRGLAIMKHYSEATQDKTSDTKLTLKQGDKERELVLVN